MTEPTSALTFDDLILVVAEQLGVAYYGADGTEAAQIPTDTYLLDRCKRYVQDGIRMFIADSPPAGWRWQRPLASVDIWATAGLAMPTSDTGGNLATGVHADDVTTVTAASSQFLASHADQVLSVRGHGLFTIDAYVSGTQVTLTAETDYSWTGSKSISVVDPTDEPTVTGAYSGVTELTTITASENTFFQSTEGATMYVTDETDGITLATYVSAVAMTVAGDVSWDGAKTFSVPSDGTYAMPADFGGEYIGEITYAAGSNLGTGINWSSELEIRRLRENWNDTSSSPYHAAVRRNQSNSRRWDLLVYPTPSSTHQVRFPYLAYFDSMVELTEVHPAGFAHDETVKAAILAQAEHQGEDVLASRMQYYRDIALPNSFKVDLRSAPKYLGYNGNWRGSSVPLGDFRQFQRRPNVPYRS